MKLNETEQTSLLLKNDSFHFDSSFMFDYARDNLIVLKIFIKDPFYTK
jgi:hypothetical protein